MKMKLKLICLLLTAAVFAACLCACGEGTTPEPATEAVTADAGSGHDLYIRDTAGKELSARFFSTESGEEVTVTPEVLDEEGDETVYHCAADTVKYDRVVITSDGRDSEQLAFNDYVSGWELSPGRSLPFTYGKENPEPTFERKTFPYEERTKDILIWTPEDYDASSSDRYSVIYMTDGQNLFLRTATSTGSWAVAESISAMMAQSDHKVIVVGIENADGWRDNELTPDLGEPVEDNYADGHGAYYSDFVVGTVMPYIEENYNVYTDREHTAMCGSSSGGIESFYIAMEHPEKFGTVGALSPAFGLFGTDTWDKYLSEKDFSAGYPKVYIYNGAGDDLEAWLLAGAQDMPDSLKKIGYPEENITQRYCDEAMHNELYWRVIFPEFLTVMFG